MRSKFVCPQCGGRLTMLTYYDGFSRERIDPDTGECNHLIDDEMENVHSQEINCANCEWAVGGEWLESQGKKRKRHRKTSQGKDPA